MRFKEFLEDQFNKIFESIQEEREAEINEQSQPDAEHKQPWGKFKPKDHGSYPKEEFHKFYHEHIKPHLDKHEPAFHRMLKSAKSHNVKVLAGRKPVESFYNKSVERGKGAENIHDALRGAIVTETPEKAHEVVKRLKKKYDVIEHDYKEKDDAKAGGYHGSHHLKVNIGGVAHEVQIMHKKLWQMKKQAHKIYAKHRTNPEAAANDPVVKKDMNFSRALFKRANRQNDRKSR